jgi:predicted  nucleic acid-binding Zn-ribbon protein
LREINATGIARTDAQNNLKLLTQKLQSNQRDISNAENQLNDIEAEIQTLAGEIVQLTYDIAQTKAQFWELLPEEFGIRISEKRAKGQDGKMARWQ